LQINCRVVVCGLLGLPHLRFGATAPLPLLLLLLLLA